MVWISLCLVTFVMYFDFARWNYDYVVDWLLWWCLYCMVGCFVCGLFWIIVLLVLLLSLLEFVWFTLIMYLLCCVLCDYCSCVLRWWLMFGWLTVMDCFAMFECLVLDVDYAHCLRVLLFTLFIYFILLVFLCDYFVRLTLELIFVFWIWLIVWCLNTLRLWLVCCFCVWLF